MKLYYAIAFLLMSLMFNRCQKDTTIVASFTYQEGYLFARESILFNSTSINASSSEWNFGDSSVGIGSTVSHFYQNPGEYVVKLTVKNSEGIPNSTTQVINVFDRTKPKKAKLKEVELAYYNPLTWESWDYEYNSPALSSNPDIFYEITKLNTGAIIASSYSCVLNDANNYSQFWDCTPLINIDSISSSYNISIYDKDGSYLSKELMFSRDFIISDYSPRTTLILEDAVFDTINKASIEVEWFYE